jgi:non-ribosomal peptide synthetase component F
VAPSLTWFLTPSPERPGTTNLCYHALDRRVIAGEATSPALTAGDLSYDVARLLEETGALAGAFRALGVLPGNAIAIGLADPLDRFLAVLAALRLGAVASLDNPGSPASATTPPALVVTDGTLPVLNATPAILRGPEAVDPVWQLDWAVAVRVGRAEPAPVADVPGDAPALRIEGRLVMTVDVLEDDSAPARHLAALAAGELVVL